MQGDAGRTSQSSMQEYTNVWKLSHLEGWEDDTSVRVVNHVPELFLRDTSSEVVAIEMRTVLAIPRAGPVRLPLNADTSLARFLGTISSGNWLACAGTTLRHEICTCARSPFADNCTAGTATS